MLDIATVKELVGDPTISNQAAEAIRDSAIAFAEIAIEAWELQHAKSPEQSMPEPRSSGALMSDD